MLNNKITYCRASTDEELSQILKLQRKNLPDSLSKSEKDKEGFLTVVHTFETLREYNTGLLYL